MPEFIWSLSNPSNSADEMAIIVAINPINPTTGIKKETININAEKKVFFEKNNIP